MAELSICPHCGRSLPLDHRVDASPIVFASEASGTVETIVPVTSHGEEHEPGSAASAADSSASRSRGGEDGATTLPAFEPRSLTRLRDSDEFPTNGSGGYDPLVSPVADPHLDVFASASSDANGEDPASWPAHPVANPLATPQRAASDSTMDAEAIERAPWLVMLLASYASAMTIAVAWLLWHGYSRGAEVKATLPSTTRVSWEKRLANQTPIGEGNRVRLGRTITVDSLKFTPVSLTFGPVMLESVRPDGSVERTGGGHCLILAVMLENTSKRESFAPLERSALRHPDSGECESFIALAGSIVESYPLAISSERSVMGQNFGSLAPGHHFQTILVSEPDANDRLDGPAIWRVPVRVSPDRIVTIGIDFTPQDVH